MQSADVTATFCATLVDEWFEAGVRYAVVAPGSRSTPMALAMVNHPQLNVQVFHDERSAAFAALGIARVTGVPTLLLCTSGTATANFHPAVMEASHAEVPLLVLTADRPPELQGVGAPQTTDQQRLYGTSLRLFIDAGIPDDERKVDWRGIASRVLVASVGDRPGPVQVNLPFREPLLGTVDELPARTMASAASPHARTGASRHVLPATRSTPVGTEILAKLAKRLSGRRGVIIAGDRAGSPTAISRLSTTLGWPVFADPLGGCRYEDELSIRHADGWLRDDALASKFTPDVILRFGALPASKVVNTWLRECGAEVVAVTESPFLIDPDRRVSMHVFTDTEALCRDVGAIVNAADGEWTHSWARAESKARAALAAAVDVEGRLSEPYVARLVVESTPRGGSVVVSSSMPIRDVEWYAGATDHVRVVANRGVNGIDGVVSTAIGVAIGRGVATTLLIGDVAFLHDSNGLLGLAQRGVDLRIVVVDNRGGGIFSFLAQRGSMAEEEFERLFGTPHEVDILRLVGAHGIRSCEVATAAELRTSLLAPGPSVTLVRTNRAANVLEHERLNRAIIAAVAE
ncbi:MAG: 2-succinyl-5-enolpyruvyl-6-hydroxy-3-cyclohexene-1-carboxylic-acid synthase [Ilumatobacteraceae bacterium]